MVTMNYWHVAGAQRNGRGLSLIHTDILMAAPRACSAWWRRLGIVSLRFGSDHRVWGKSEKVELCRGG